jgi:uncharacterized protein (DUF2249 family)
VREDIRNGREPFSRIMSTVAALKPNEKLLLIAPFEPAPLYAVLGQQGFSHQANSTEAGDWEVLFVRESSAEVVPAPKTGRSAASHPSSPPGETCVELDARGLEPPEPLVKILEALPALPAGGQIRARTDRRPMHLYAQLEERGFAGESTEQSDGSFVTLIRRL